MGTFTHESACVDRIHKRVYMTEDEKDGRLYRFTPANYPDLSSGVLQVATVGSGGRVRWKIVPDPSAISAPTRKQVTGTRFNGGEGMWFDSGIVYFTTKGDNRVHAYDTRSGRYELIYDEATTPDAPLQGLDGITVSRSGDLYLCEDGGDLDVCMITPARVVSRFLKLTGGAHDDSELTGVVFDPSGSRLYFSSMRGFGQGVTYEVSGPFRGSGPTQRHRWSAEPRSTGRLRGGRFAFEPATGSACPPCCDGGSRCGPRSLSQEPCPWPCAPATPFPPSSAARRPLNPASCCSPVQTAVSPAREPSACGCGPAARFAANCAGHACPACG